MLSRIELENGPLPKIVSQSKNPIEVKEFDR